MKLRWYQKQAVAAAFDYIKNNKGKHPVLGLPTGAGKSIIIDEIVYTCYKKWNVNTLVISHNAEIIEQDYNSIIKYFDSKGENCPIGLYSAGLKSRKVNKITVAGIQSIYRKPELFKDVKLIIIDEAHLISTKSNTMYRKFLGEIDAIYLGLTATPFRLGTGYIYGKDQLFDDICYDLTSLDSFVRLIKDGYLSQLVTKQTITELDTEGVRTVAGDFSEKDLALKFNRDQITNAAIDEIIKYGNDRKSWLIFAIDIKHAESIARELLRRGIKTNVVHSKMEFDRKTVINDFKTGKYRCIVNVNVLTTGFDHPGIDLIACLRPTKSPVLHVQSIGRGLRTAEGKENCLILDFAMNTKRLGPINAVQVYKKRKTKGGGKPITKTCPQCDSILHPRVMTCPDCGYKFPENINVSASSDTSNVILESSKRWYKITDIVYSYHNNGKTPPSMKVSYQCGLKVFHEWICFSHTGYAKQKANYWAKIRLNYFDKSDLNNTENMMKYTKDFKRPERILVDETNKYPIIIDYDFSA